MNCLDCIFHVATEKGYIIHSCLYAKADRHKAIDISRVVLHYTVHVFPILFTYIGHIQ